MNLALQLDRLDAQTSSLEEFRASAPEEVFAAHPIPGKWSAQEQLAHLTRYVEVTLARLEAMLALSGQPFARYNAETDPDWPAWQTLGLDALWQRFTVLRPRFKERLMSLSASELAATGTHPLLGTLSVQDLFEMFLWHEAHHLYSVFQCLKIAGKP